MNEDFMKKYEEARLKQTKRESTLKYVSTSYADIDRSLGGGIPLGKVIEISGEAGVGKSALVQDIIMQAQLESLSCVYMDIERKFDAYWARERANVNTDDLLLFEPKTTEGIVPACVALMEQGLADLIIIDSVSAMNIEGSLKDVLNPLLQKIVEYNTAIILISQVRQDLENGGLTTPHNGVLDQVCNVRMMLKQLHIIKQEELIVGKTVEVNIYKNDMATPEVKQVELFI
jgi:recombination protein RecA